LQEIFYLVYLLFHFLLLKQTNLIFHFSFSLRSRCHFTFTKRFFIYLFYYLHFLSQQFKQNFVFFTLLKRVTRVGLCDGDNLKLEFWCFSISLCLILCINIFILFSWHVFRTLQLENITSSLSSLMNRADEDEERQKINV
jgi:hypothetical protein